MVWYGMVWYGNVCIDKVPGGKVWDTACDIVWDAVIWYGKERGSEWYGMTCSISRCMIWCGMLYHMVWYWYSML
jgi:hypothetical protein